MNRTISTLRTSRWTQKSSKFLLNSSSSPCNSKRFPLVLHHSSRRRINTSTSNQAHNSTSTSTSDPRHILDILSERSLLQSTTSRALRAHLGDSASDSNSDSNSTRTIYAGVDPSAPSLHVGNLLPLMCLLWLAKHGHRVIVVIGGATGSIGDPSGRSTERSSLSSSELKHNVESITKQVLDFFDSASEYEARRNGGKKVEYDIHVINNQEWYEGMGILKFLSEVGRHARIGVMMARDSVKSRLFPSSDSTTGQAVGLSFTEFSYQLLQAYDFHVLNSSRWNCTIQVGGSDQLGNISAGIDLIRRLRASTSTSKNISSSNSEFDPDQDFSDEESEGKDSNSNASAPPAYGLTIPLLTNSNGSKFGKSAGNAIWLDKNLLSDYDFFQFFKRCNDEDLLLYFKTLTFLKIEEIQNLEKLIRSDKDNSNSDDYEKGSGQELLAKEITELVRGLDGLKKAQIITKTFFSKNVWDLNLEEIEETFKDDDRLKKGCKRKDFVGLEITKIMNLVGASKSRGEARRLLQSKGLALNGLTLNEERNLTEEDLIKDKFFILRSGKVGHHLVLLDD